MIGGVLFIFDKKFIGLKVYFQKSKEREKFMERQSFDFYIDDFLLFCRSRQLREKTMLSYEQALRLFERWCWEQFQIDAVERITESLMRKYINDLMSRGKYSYYCNDATKQIN